MMFGGILNVVLDPVLIFILHMDVAGAALATALSNIASVVFFAIQYLRLKDKTAVSLHPRYFTFRFMRPIFSVGLASALATALGNASNMVMPVSYTHLDVYKRQVASLGICFRSSITPFPLHSLISWTKLHLIYCYYTTRKKVPQLFKYYYSHINDISIGS